MDRLTPLLAEYGRTLAATIANFERRGGGRGKQGKRQTDAALRRGAQFSEQLRRLESEIHALGGTLPGSEPDATPDPVPAEPITGPTDPRTMTREALQAEDATLETERREAGARTLLPRHRAIKAELGAYAAADLRARNSARRSASAKRGAATRAARKAAGLPPKRLEWCSPPPGGWTDADRVS